MVSNNDNELVKTIQKERPELSYWDKTKNVGYALKHFFWDKYFNPEEYERMETAHKYLKVYKKYYPKYTQINNQQ